MKKLSERLQASAGPDRELDARIWCHRNGKKYCGHAEPYGERDGFYVQVVFTSPPQRKQQVTNFPSVPHPRSYTASIDAALTLVPEGWTWQITRGVSDTRVTIVHPDCEDYTDPKTVFSATAATPALAICIAALDAFESGEKS